MFEPIFRPDTHQDGHWHAIDSFSPQPIRVDTLKGVQHHRGSRALIKRWDGTKWEYKHCYDIHKNRKTTFTCAERFARVLNKELEEQ